MRAKLDQPLALGYCHVGEVVSVGEGVKALEVGDRVATNGKHAEMVAVPQNLAARVPEGVSDDAAAFTVPGAIALQGIRLLQPTLGEAVVVTGLGLIGLLAVQLLRLHGCRVLGIDPDPAKLRMAASFGAEICAPQSGESVLDAAARFSRGRGVDGVLIAASTASSEPVHEAAEMCRKRGRIVLVGVTGLELRRSDFYEKELTFQVSCSYGPGRYDPAYEEGGQDYPIGFVRWTEQRNMEAVLDMMADGRLDPSPLVSHRYAIEDAADAYDLITSAAPSLGVLLDYPGEAADLRNRHVRLVPDRAPAGKGVIGAIGAGNYASRILLPAFKEAGGDLHTVASKGGVSGHHVATKLGFAGTTTDIAAIIDDAAIDTVVIATRHDSHASLVMRALEAGKHVFVEKPLCLTLEELESIETALDAASPQALLMVGFNRRFAPQISAIREGLGPGAKSLVMTVNAGAVPAKHWTRDPEIGGGRIIGEGCHFIDLLRYLAGAPITEASLIHADSDRDNAMIQLAFGDGSIGAVHYLTEGHRGLAKERLEVFQSGRVIRLDNFRKLETYGGAKLKPRRLYRQDKGQRACAAAFLRAVKEGQECPIPLGEVIEIARATIELARSGSYAAELA